MRKDTILRKKATQGLAEFSGELINSERMTSIIRDGKKALDLLSIELGKQFVEAILYLERETLAGPDYNPKNTDLQKWASQEGSVYFGDQKIKVQVPRLRHRETGEVTLKSYSSMKRRGGLAEQVLEKSMRGLSGRKYEETVLEAAGHFGVSPSAISRDLVEVTGKKLKAFKERELSDFKSFCIFLDTIHMGQGAFIVALGMNIEGEKIALGFWEGATENSEVCNELFSDLERRGLILSDKILWVTDGGKGIIKSLKDRFGNKLLHQRCTIHKNRNIQKHLPRKYRSEASFQYQNALKQNTYQDAKAMLLTFEKWLRKINESAADSLLEALEELLTLHRLKVPHLLKKALHSTNSIESMFSSVRNIQKNIKRIRNSHMSQRWLGASLLACEKNFRKVKGFENIPQVLNEIEIQRQNSEYKKDSAA